MPIPRDFTPGAKIIIPGFWQAFLDLTQLLLQAWKDSPSLPNGTTLEKLAGLQAPSSVVNDWQIQLVSVQCQARPLLTLSYTPAPSGHHCAPHCRWEVTYLTSQGQEMPESFKVKPVTQAGTLLTRSYGWKGLECLKLGLPREWMGPSWDSVFVCVCVSPGSQCIPVPSRSPGVWIERQLWWPTKALVSMPMNVWEKRADFIPSLDT